MEWLYYQGKVKTAEDRITNKEFLYHTSLLYCTQKPDSTISKCAALAKTAVSGKKRFPAHLRN
jgi:hypothetical protein